MKPLSDLQSQYIELLEYVKSIYGEEKSLEMKHMGSMYKDSQKNEKTIKVKNTTYGD